VEELHAPDRARRRLLLGVGGVTLALAAVGGFVVTTVPRIGGELPDDERQRLLEQAGLPADFPVHPYARRASQPALGGITYTLAEPVPDVLVWQRDSLVRSGYQVFNADVAGQDEFLPRWLYFRSEDGASGAIIVRQTGRGPMGVTEVKILSRADERLAPPTPVAGTPRR
jgi:hypothetical protein